MLFGEEREAMTVVGVVEDASRGSIRENPHMVYYMPVSQRSEGRLNGLFVRVSGRPSDVAPVAAEALRALDPRVRFTTVAPLQAQIDPQARAWTLGAAMFSVFGLLALVVAAIGLYSVLAFDIAQRTRELGIRTALGAERSALLRAVVFSGVRLAGLGILVGLVVSILAAPYIQDLLFEVSARDPGVLAGVAAALVAVSVAASLLPGLRATRVDPMEALRTD
jgi:ABC-type antimicrobial peptide transport system permease subunit